MQHVFHANTKQNVKFLTTNSLAVLVVEIAANDVVVVVLVHVEAVCGC